MSNLNLNNVYWSNENLCPAVMNDGRGGLTNFKNNKVITNDLYKKYNSYSPNNFRSKMQSKEVVETLDKEWKNVKCNNDPSGVIKFKEKIELNNGNQKLSFLDQFKSLIDDDYSDQKYNNYKLV